MRARALADAATILLFVTIGQLSHHGHVTAGGYAADALPLLGCWFGAAALFRYRWLPTWFVGVSAGVLVRAAVLGHWYAKELAFWLVALAFLGGVTLVTRAAARTPLRRRTARSAPAGDPSRRSRPARPAARPRP